MVILTESENKAFSIRETYLHYWLPYQKSKYKEATKLKMLETIKNLPAIESVSQDGSATGKIYYTDVPNESAYMVVARTGDNVLIYGRGYMGHKCRFVECSYKELPHNTTNKYWGFEFADDEISQSVAWSYPNGNDNIFYNIQERKS